MSMRKKKEIETKRRNKKIRKDIFIITIVTYFFLAILPNLVLTNIKIMFKNYLTITLINDNLIKENKNKKNASKRKKIKKLIL